MANTDQSFYDFYVDTVGGGIANGDLQTQWYSSLGGEAVNSSFGAAANMFGNQASAAVQDAAYWRNIASNWQNVANTMVLVT